MDNWTERDLEELDAKFDALCEHLGIEFVFEKVSDGSENADSERIYIRSKAQRFPEKALPMPTKRTRKRRGYNY